MTDCLKKQGGGQWGGSVDKATKLDALSLIPGRTHMVEGQNPFSQVVLLPINTFTHRDRRIDSQINTYKQKDNCPIVWEAQESLSFQHHSKHIQ